MKTLVVEHTAPFQALPELVADAEGLFAREGLKIEWVNTNEGVDRSARTDVLNPKGLDPFRSHGRLLEQGKADMYNACEWGNYCRVQDTGVKSRQLGRRSVVTLRRHRGASGLAGLHAAAARAPQGRRAVLFRHALSRAAYARRLPDARRDRGVQRAARLALPLRSADEGRNRSHDADRALCDATPRSRAAALVCTAFYHGTQVGTDAIDAETMSAYNRAVTEAVRRIKANKRGYLHYFIDYHKARDPEIGTLTVDDLRESRLVVCRAGADPGRRDAAHLRVGEELGHAGDDADAARTRQHGRHRRAHAVAETPRAHKRTERGLVAM